MVVQEWKKEKSFKELATKKHEANKKFLNSVRLKVELRILRAKG